VQLLDDRQPDWSGSVVAPQAAAITVELHSIRDP